MNQPALIVIDVQNDYFADGAFPLWQADAALSQVEAAVAHARAHHVPVILVQHIAAGPAPFFNRDSHGVAIHPRLLAAAPEAPVVIKTHADSFLETDLQATLDALGVDSLWLCGMMTQNCVTHTALSPAAARYPVTVLGDASTTVSEILHILALRALAPRVAVKTVAALSAS